MSVFIVSFLQKKKQEKALDVAIGIMMAVLALLSFALCAVYFEQIGQVLYYALSISGLLVCGFAAIFFFINAASSSYLISFFASKQKDPKEVKSEIVEISRHTVDRHFDSYKVKGKEGFFFWAMPLGDLPLEENKKYSLLVWGVWIVGWKEEE